MKRNSPFWTGLLAVTLLGLAHASAQLGPATNRLTFSLRFGLNISGNISGNTAVTVPPSTRPTPSGGTYNYDDGYLFPDISGSGDGYTWYWGYDNASQIDSGNNTLLLSRSTGAASLSTPDLDSDPAVGLELTYLRELGTTDDIRYGIEGALNFLNISVGGSGSHTLTSAGVTDAYAYLPGTTPPGAPYQGTFGGPGFVVGSTPVSSTATVAIPVGSVTGSREYDGTLWGGRVGPYAEFYLKPGLSLSLSGGLAVGWLNSSVSWNETYAFNAGGSVLDTGSGSDNTLLWGGYLAANLHWRLSDRWSAAGGVQFQSLGQYDETFGTRRVELDLGKSFLINLGATYNF